MIRHEASQRAHFGCQSNRTALKSSPGKSYTDERISQSIIKDGLMFGVFSKISNKEIEQVVRKELAALDTEGEIFGAINGMLEFADQNSLGQWQRARFSAEGVSYMAEQGWPKKAAEVVGRAIGTFVSRVEPILGVHRRGYECGVDCAVMLAGGLDNAAYAGAELVDEYVAGNIEQRESINRSYRLGLRSLKNKAIEKRMAERFLSIIVSAAYGTHDLTQETQEELEAWRRREILPHVAKRYLQSKQAGE